MAFHWKVQRQLIPQLARDLPGSCSHIIGDFSCSVNDEYRVEGEMMMALPPFVAKFSPGLLGGFLLGVADEDGHLKLIDTRNCGPSAVVKGWSAHSNAVFDIAWVNDDSKMVTASGDQTARLWDIQKCETVGIFRGHTCSLKSVNIQPQSTSVFATGARDGNVMLWDTRCCMKNGYYGPVNTIYGAHKVDVKSQMSVGSKKKKPRRLSVLQQDSKQSVTSVVFQDDYHIFTAGACDGLIKLWDLRKTPSVQKSNVVPFHSIPYPGQGVRRHGYSCLLMNSNRSRLYASCTNDTIYMFETINHSSSPKAVFTGHQASTFYIKAGLSVDGRFLISGSGDSNAYIWDTERAMDDPWILKGHCGEVTSVAWCQTDIGKIATCSDDNTFRIWRSRDLHQSVDEIQPLLGRCEKLKSRELPSEEICKDCKRRRRSYFASNPKVFSSSFRVKTCKSCRKRDSINLLSENESHKSISCSPAPSNTTMALPEQKTPQTPKDSKSLMETWLKSPSVIKKKNMKSEQDTYNNVSEVNVTVNVTPTRGLPLNEKNTTPNHLKEDKINKRTILVALKSPKDSDLLKGRKRQRNSCPASNLRFSAKRKRDNSDKENTPNKVQKVLPLFSNNSSDRILPKTDTDVRRSSTLYVSSQKPNASSPKDILEISEDEEFVEKSE